MARSISGTRYDIWYPGTWFDIFLYCGMMHDMMSMWCDVIWYRRARNMHYHCHAERSSWRSVTGLYRKDSMALFCFLFLCTRSAPAAVDKRATVRLTPIIYTLTAVQYGYDTVPYDTMWYDVILYYMIWYDTKYDMIWYDMILRMIWYCNGFDALVRDPVSTFEREGLCRLRDEA